MSRIVIRNTKRETLFEGPFATMKLCLEAAIAENVDLEGADLSRADLSGASLDGARLNRSLLTGSNLTGANLSEAALDGVDFSDAALHGTCLCLSAMRGCRFDGALFGGTDIAGCDIRDGVFSTLSAFTLNFRDSRIMAGCAFADMDGNRLPMSRPPVVVTGLASPVALLDSHIMIGHEAQPLSDLRGRANDNLPRRLPSLMYGHRDMLALLAATLRPDRPASGGKC